MKTILIEAVSNGWIVRPFQCCDTRATTDRPAMAVFNSLADLQAALPDLLVDEKLIRPAQSGTPGGDRRPETIEPF